MPAEFEIIERDKTNTIEMYREVTMTKIAPTLKNSFEQLLNYLKEHNEKPAEAPYVKYTGFDWNELMNESKLKSFFKMFTRKWKMNIGIPVNEKLEGRDEMQPTVIPAGKYVKGIHKGSYQKVGGTYAEMFNWIDEKGIDIAKESYELYISNPAETKVDDLETVVLIPVKE